MSARRAMVRWALRLFRREWRQQALVLALLTVAVAAGTLGEAGAFAVAPSRDADFGSARYRLILRSSARGMLAADIAAARAYFGTIDVVTSRSVPVPGSVDSVEVRAQDPNGPFGVSTLRLVSGRWPAEAGELAVTDGVASTLGVSVGSSSTIGDRPVTVVGLVENPGRLDEEFALEAPTAASGAESAAILVSGAESRVTQFRTLDGSRPNIQRRGSTERSAAAVAGLGAATLLLLLISLVATAGFAVVAQRRLRQLGMLAAIGATRRHLRLVMLANGVIVGAVAAAVGTAAGVALWVVGAPRLEAAVGHRIDRLDLPWPVVGTGMAVAVVVATAAAWWPARSVARIPVTLALAARVPRPKTVHRSALAAVVLLAGGAVGVAVGIDPVRDASRPLPLIGGIVALGASLVMAGPLAVRLAAAAGSRAPLAVRIALRDLGRYQARSAAALAAISLALGIAVTAVLAAGAAVHGEAEGNLSNGQLLFRIGSEEPVVPARTASQLTAMQTAVDGFAATLDRAAVVALDVAIDPAVRETAKGEAMYPALSLGRKISENTRRFEGLLYVATPELLGHLGLAGLAVAPDVDVLTTKTGDLAYVNGPRGKAPTPTFQAIDATGYSSAPTSLITPSGLARGGWQDQRAGWLVETEKPLTAAQRRAARDMAAAAGITVETRDQQRSLAAVQTGATAAGALLALGVLAMTVGLIRSESAADMRTLIATGATTRIRRTVTATTTGALGFLGVVLGTGAAYVGMVGGYSGKLEPLSRVPVVHLSVTVVGIPVVAALAGWLLAGRTPPATTQAAFD